MKKRYELSESEIKEAIAMFIAEQYEEDADRISVELSCVMPHSSDRPGEADGVIRFTADATVELS